MPCVLWGVSTSCRLVLQVIGGLDETLFKGVMQYVPIHKEWYYEVVITDISVGGESLNMDCKEVTVSVLVTNRAVFCQFFCNFL